MKKNFFWVLFFLLMLTKVYCAPMPPTEAVNLTGEIQSIQWEDERHASGQWGMSGSLGSDRSFPAGYWIVLRNVISEVSEQALALEDQKPTNTASKSLKVKKFEKYEVFINHAQNNDFYRKGMKIKVLDYLLSGDEGGVWYSNSGVEIIENLSDEKGVKGESKKQNLNGLKIGK